MADRDKVTLADIQASMSPAVRAQIEKEMGKTSSLPAPSRRGKGKSITAADIEAMPASTRDAVVKQLRDQGGQPSPQIQKILNLVKTGEQDKKQALKESADLAKRNEQQMAAMNEALNRLVASQNKTVGLVKELVETAKNNKEQEDKKNKRSRKLMNVIMGALMLLGGGMYLAAGITRMMGNESDATPQGSGEGVGEGLAPDAEGNQPSALPAMPTTPGESISVNPEDLEDEEENNQTTNAPNAVPFVIPTPPAPAPSSAPAPSAAPAQATPVSSITGSTTPQIAGVAAEEVAQSTGSINLPNATPVSRTGSSQSAASGNDVSASPVDTQDLVTRVSAPAPSAMPNDAFSDDGPDATPVDDDQDAFVEGDYTTTQQAEQVKSELPVGMRDVTFKASEIRFKADEFKFESENMMEGAGGAGLAPSGAGGGGSLATPTAFRTAAPPPTITGGGGLQRPISTPITSGFGQRALGNHEGLDFGAPEGTPVVSAQSGTVVRAESSPSYGNVVYVRGDDGTETRYAHLSSIGVQQGQRVEQGQPVGLSGNTGRSFGPHLHFEYIKDGQKVDPAPLLGMSQEARESTPSQGSPELGETEAAGSRTTGAGSAASAVPTPPSTPGSTLAAASQARSMAADMPASMSAEPASVNVQPEMTSDPTTFGAPTSMIDPNEPGPVEPPDAVDRYRRLFNMAA